MLVGLGWRKPIASWIASFPEEIQCLEITAEHFFDRDERVLSDLRQRVPLFVHGLGLSLGTPGPIDPDTLCQFKRVARMANAKWVSEHVAFTRTGDVDLGHLNPILPTRATLRVLVDHVKQLADECGCPVLLENITSEVRLDGEIREVEFLHEVCDRADCSLLLDVTNLFINSKNHNFDPIDWFAELPASRIRQLHVVGYGLYQGFYQDVHTGCIQADLWSLIDDVINSSPELQAVTIEWDHTFPDTAVLTNELRLLQSRKIPRHDAMPAE